MSEEAAVTRRIGVVNANASTSATALIGDYLAPLALPGTRLTVVGARRGPQGIDGPWDAAVGAVEAAALVAEHAESVDAFVLACGNDPGLDACRQASSRPVVGIAEAGLLTASLVAASFSVVVLSPSKATAMRRLVRGYGHGERLASVVAMETHASALFAQPEQGLERLIAACASARDRDGAEAIVLPGAAMAGNEQRMSEALGIPVVCGLSAALRTAEALVDLRLRTSAAHSYRPRGAAPPTAADGASFDLDLDGVTGPVPTPGVPA